MPAIILLLLLLSGLIWNVSSGAASGLPLLLTSWSEDGFQVRPTGAIQLSADGTLSFGGAGHGNKGWASINWTQWTTSAATGRGEIHANQCVPACAGSTVWAEFPGTLRAYGVRNGKFQHFTITRSNEGHSEIARGTLLTDIYGPLWRVSGRLTSL
jgi:hypothetical protein